ncbi:MAG TPA: GNAT family N-acetyltransferase [Patescibacteria group bacterium]|nr:GNAT family N-acetyltransferase [Patescibacteria group bacterium]
MADANAIDDARNYTADAVMLDGSAIRVRAIRPDDKDRLLEHFHGLSGKSVYFRFMGIRRDLSLVDLTQLTELDFKTHVGLVATLTLDSRERFIGVGRYICGKDPTRAEVAFAILDGFQGRGIGTILLQHLSRIAVAGGVEEFEADVLGENRQMLEVFAHSGFKRERLLESGVVHLRASTRALLKK